LVLVVALPLRAQSSAWWLDVGGAAVRQPNSTVRQAATFGIGGARGGVFGTATDARGAWSIAGDGAFTFAQDSVDAAQGVLRASLTPSRAPWATSDVEVSATAIGIRLPGSNGTQSVALQQGVHRGSLRVFVGAGVGRTSRYLLDSRGADVNAGIGITRGTFTGSVTLQQATTDDWQLMEASGFALTRAAPSYALRDARIDVAWRVARVQLTASGSARAGTGATRGNASGLSGTATFQLGPALQLVALGGRQLADPLRGVPQADYAALVARWQRRRVAALSSSRLPSLTETRVVRNAEATLEPSAGGAELVVRIAAAADAVVEIASSATEWTPVRAVREGQQFVARLVLASGTHRVAVRVSGGSWRAPRGLVRVDDEFGGAAGIVVVP
jgi:hypothetical protein